MAKSSKDLTTFTGGLINAEEPSDAGEDNGMFNIENLEGLYKKGVLKPSGVLADRTTGIADIDGGAATGTGVGYNVMQSDWNADHTKILHYGFDNDDGDVRVNSIPNNAMNDWNASHLPWFLGSDNGQIGFQPTGNIAGFAGSNQANDHPFGTNGIGNRTTCVDLYNMTGSAPDQDVGTCIFIETADWINSAGEDVFHIPLYEEVGNQNYQSWEVKWEPNTIYYVFVKWDGIIWTGSGIWEPLGTGAQQFGRCAYIDGSFGHDDSENWNSIDGQGYGNSFSHIGRQAGRGSINRDPNYGGGHSYWYYKTGRKETLMDQQFVRPMMYFSLCYDRSWGSGNLWGGKVCVLLKEIEVHKINTAEGKQYFMTSGDTGSVKIFDDEAANPLKTIGLYSSNSAGDHVGNDPDFLFTSNAVRIQGTDLADFNTYPAQWYGVVKRKFFKGVGDRDLEYHGLMPGWIYGSNGDAPGAITQGNYMLSIAEDARNPESYIGVDNYEFDIYGWQHVGSYLSPPDAKNCTMVNVDDNIREGTIRHMIGGGVGFENYYHNDDESANPSDGNRGAFEGMDLMSGNGTFHRYFVNDYQHPTDYQIRLEYSVDKRHAVPGTPADSDITGTWNEAADTLIPTTKETNITYRFYCTFLYDFGDQESTMTRITNIAQAGDNAEWGAGTSPPTLNQKYSDDYTHDITGEPTVRDEITLMGWETVTSHNEAPINMHDTRLTFRPMIIPSERGGASWFWKFPIRCTGVNFWYSSSADSHAARWKLIECDFVQGIKPASSLSASYMPWKLLKYLNPFFGYRQYAAGSNVNYGRSSNNTSNGGPHDWENRSMVHTGYSYTESRLYEDMLAFEDPPQFEDWEGIYGSLPESIDLVKYKTSTIIGGQAFYGNVTINEEQFRDRILVSIANGGYDMIPADNYLEVSSGDGDEIILLLNHNEKLYVFKRRSLQIVVVGEEDDQSVASSAIGGIFNKHHAVPTNIGIIWANEYGVFLNSGDETENLAIGKVNDFILDNSKDFVVGYSPKFNRVYILSSTNKAEAKILYMIDTKDKTWWKSVGSAATGSSYSNFVLDKDMNLTIMKDIDLASNQVIRQAWDPQSTSQSVLLEVGDLNLDGVTSKKQLYSIITVSKNAGSLAIVAEQTAPDGTKSVISLSPGTLSNSSTGYGKVEHVVSPDTAEDLLFANATISGVAAADMEIHSISFIYRDKGVK